MVAYSFKRRFVQSIRTGAKSQTVRNERKRHARPGELVQLYTGMRTRSCELIGTALCLAVSPIRFEFGERAMVEVHHRATYFREERDFFAQRDGFADWADLEAFWRAEHEALTAFEGVLIQWRAADLTGPPDE